MPFVFAFFSCSTPCDPFALRFLSAVLATFWSLLSFASIAFILTAARAIDSSLSTFM